MADPSAVARPRCVVVLTGTGTEVGKTWVGAALLSLARTQGLRVAARKPVQSYDPSDPSPTDAEVLAAATGESPDEVCPPHRSLPVAVAPPMAAAQLGVEPLRAEDLHSELRWPAGVDLGVVEGAGGLLSPLGEDLDTRTLVRSVGADLVVVVADAGLGTIHAVRSTLAALTGEDVEVAALLNRWDASSALHRWNRDWLVANSGVEIFTSVSDLFAALGRTLRCAGA